MNTLQISQAELVEGWADTTIGSISNAIQYGYTASAVNNSTGPRFLRITDIQDGRVNWTTVPSCEISDKDFKKFELKPGDILFARTGATTGKSFLISSCPKAVFASYLIRLRPCEGISANFLRLFFQTPDYWQLISENVSGNAQPNCNASKLSELPLQVPPVDEQNRIIDKAEALQSRANAVRTRLEKVPAILKRFRQSVLAAACSGRLTADWREAHHDIEPASKLLERILKARSAKKVESPFPDNSELVDLPASWCASSIGQLFEVCIGSTPSRKVESYWNGNINWVSSGEVAFCRITKTREMISEDGFQNSSLKLHPPGTVLIGMIGEGKTRGQVAILDVQACNNQNSAAIRVSDTIIPPNFVYRYLESQYETSRGRGAGNNQPALNKSRVQAISMPLPPLEEQFEIVRRIEALFEIATAIEKRVAAAAGRADKLTQAILKKAFRGELVPTEAELARCEGRDYEPASVLLERIRKTREEPNGAKKK